MQRLGEYGDDMKRIGGCINVLYSFPWKLNECEPVVNRMSAFFGLCRLKPKPELAQKIQACQYWVRLYLCGDRTLNKRTH